MQGSPYVVPQGIKNPPSKKKQSPFPTLIIVFSFSLMVLGAILDFMATTKEEPERADFSDEGYDEAYDEYTDSVESFSQTSDLFFVVGTLGLGVGLFFYATEASDQLPEYVRTALMLGAMYFLIRMATTEMSIFDQLSLIALLN